MDTKLRKYIERRLKLSSFGELYYTLSWIEQHGLISLEIHLYTPFYPEDEKLMVGNISEQINKFLENYNTNYRVFNETIHNGKTVSITMSDDVNRMEWHGFRKRS